MTAQPNLKQYWHESIGGIPFNRENTETDTEWGWLIKAGVLYLSFCGSNSKKDWLQNFSFWKVPYKNMPVRWKAHAGFVKKWKSIHEKVLALVEFHTEISFVSIRGYSQGAAIGVLAHEDIGFNFPDIPIMSFVFGCPRVLSLSGIKIRNRFDTFYRIKNGGDIVTGIPPWWFGYIHVGKEIQIGKKKLCTLSVEDHLIRSYTKVLEE